MNSKQRKQKQKIPKKKQKYLKHIGFRFRCRYKPKDVHMKII